MSNIKISPDTMDKRAREAGAQETNLENIMRDMNTLLNTLKGEWEGEAVKGYEDRYNKIKPVLKNAKELLGEIKSNLTTTAKIMRDTDQNIASQYRKA